MTINLLHFPSGDGPEHDFFAIAPDGMDAREARVLGNALIKEADSAWRNDPDADAWDAAAANGGIGKAIKDALARAGFVLPGDGLEIAQTEVFDGNHEPMGVEERQALESWRARQAVQTILEQRIGDSPSRRMAMTALQAVDEVSAVRLITLPSAIDDGSEFLVLPPSTLSLDDAHQLVEAVIRQKNQEDYDNEGECADGLAVGSSIRAELTRMGFVIENAGLDVKKTITWDDDHRVTPESEQVLNAWRARQAVSKVVSQQDPDSPARISKSRAKPG